MDRDEITAIADRTLAAWNVHDVPAVLACYTPDCRYLDPNLREPLVGHAAFGDYLARLFAAWRMHWAMREFFDFAEPRGGAFLWRAELTPVGASDGVTLEGIDLVVLDGDRLARNEVYFDRARLVALDGGA